MSIEDAESIKMVMKNLKPDNDLKMIIKELYNDM